MKAKLLVIDDDVFFLQSLRNFLEYQDYQVVTIANTFKAKEIFAKEAFDCVFIDLKMSGINGFELMEYFLNARPLVPIILISGYATIQMAIQAIKAGAYDFIEKPLNGERLLVTLKNALQKQILEQEKSALKAQIDASFPIIYRSKSIDVVMRKIKSVAPTNAKVLITGESGTGKELVARAIHFQSKRAFDPFVRVNCAAIPNALLESELFGYRKGAFTDAHNDYPGKFLAAEGGSLFLDEIGDMNLQLQAKLLRALQDGEISMLGEDKSQKVNVRFISATNKNILQLVTEGLFRKDLFHRLNVVEIHIPPLRERKEDIPLLANYFLKKYTQAYNKTITHLEDAAINVLQKWKWPGNVRELQNLIEKLVILSNKSIITSQEIQNALYRDTSLSAEDVGTYSGRLKKATEDFERYYILKSLHYHEWKIGKTATALGINRTVLFRKMRKYGIQKEK